MVVTTWPTSYPFVSNESDNRFGSLTNMNTSKDSAEQIIATLESGGQTLSEEEKNEIAIHQKGRALEHVVNTFGWDVVLEMLQDYVSDASRQLIDMPPGDSRVVQAHAAASAVNDLYYKFIRDVKNAIDISRTTPSALMRVKKAFTETPIESM